MKRIQVVLALAALGVGAAVACSFPSIGYEEATGGSAATSTSTSSAGGSATTTSSSSTSGSTGGATGSGGAESDGGMDAGVDAYKCVDASAPCDCDGDGDNAATAECDFDGGDCNDHDPLVNSKQTAWFTMPGSNGWDYNCDGQDEYEYVGDLSCPELDCDTSDQKWSGGSTPGCGQAGPYATCGWYDLFICGNGPDLGMRTQGCH